MIEARTVFYIGSLNVIGGVESWMYYIAKKFGKRKDFVVLYDNGDMNQIIRLMQYCQVRKYNDEQVKCETAIFCYNQEIIGNIKAKNYYQFIHGNMEAVKKIHPSMELLPAPQITKQFSVSKITQEGYRKVYNKETELFYNIIDIDKPKKVLRLITASRLNDPIKGYDIMIKVADKLEQANIPYIWLCFSDRPGNANDSKFVFLKPELDILPYMADADYLVQTSRDESYGYSIVESLMLDTPVIVMDIPVLKELGIEDGKNGYVLNFDLSNLDVNKIYNNIPIVKGYKPPMDVEKWEDILGEDIERGDVLMKYEVKAIKEFDDAQEFKDGKSIHRSPSSDFWIVDEERYIYLLKNKAIKLVNVIAEKIEVKEEEKPSKKTAKKKN